MIKIEIIFFEQLWKRLHCNNPKYVINGLKLTGYNSSDIGAWKNHHSLSEEKFKKYSITFYKKQKFL